MKLNKDTYKKIFYFILMYFNLKLSIHLRIVGWLSFMAYQSLLVNAKSIFMQIALF